MDCYEFKSQLSEFCEDELSVPARKRFILHRDECPECADLLTEFQSALRAIHSLPRLSTADDFNQRLRERIDQEVSVTFWQRLQNFISGSALPRYVVATAFVLVGLMVGMRYLGLEGPAPQSVQPPVESPELNVQQPMNQQELLDQVSTMTADSLDTNQVLQPRNPRSYEAQIQYVKSRQ